MKKIIIPLIMVAVVVTLIFAGCRPAVAPAPPVAPAAPRTAADVPELAGLCRPDLAMDYGEPFAFKPDGTPYRVACDYVNLRSEEMQNYEGVLRTNFQRAGCVYTLFDTQLNVDIEVAYLEDLAAVTRPDIIVNHTCSEWGTVPAINKCAEAGIQIYSYDLPLFSDNCRSHIHHWHEGPLGSGINGEKFVEIVEETGEHLTILEVWCVRAMLFSQQRHEGFYNAIKPLIDEGKITLIESIDNMGSDETAATIVIDNLTAHPEINAIYMQCGGQTGVVSGLRAVGKLKPIGDPEHIIVNTYEGATPVMAEMEKGNIDYVATHGPWDVCDLIVKVVLWDAVCGVRMPQDIVLPMYLLSPETLTDPDYFMYGALYWTQMPPGRWELWPIQDHSTPGCLALLPEYLKASYHGDYTPWQLEAPSVEDRKANMGY